MEPGLGHACGVFGVYAPGQPVAHLAYLGLYALQHRGQESAGIAVSDGETITVVKDMGLVTQVFDERRLAPLDGHLAIGHNRYSTTGSSTWRNAQPVYRSVGDAGFALGHNGNLTNTVELADAARHAARLLNDRPKGLDSTTDSALVAELIANEYEHGDETEPRSDGRDLELALERVLPRLEGGFSLVLMDEAHLIGVRDRHGFWPLVLGRVEGGWVLASEIGRARHRRRALRARGRARRDDRDRRERRARAPLRRARPEALPVRVRLLRPTRHLRSTATACTRPASAWARSSRARRPVDADMVMPVPESGIPAAQGLRARVGHPLRRRPGEEPLRRPHVHPAEPAAARCRRAHEAQPAPREHPRQAARRRRRLDRPRHDHPPGRRDAARGRAPRRCTSACRRRRTAGPATTAWTPAAGPSCSPPTCRSARSPDFLNVDSLAYLELDRLTRATGAPADAVLHGVPLGRLPGARSPSSR